jgi:hypothetical protein
VAECQLRRGTGAWKRSGGSPRSISTRGRVGPPALPGLAELDDILFPFKDSAHIFGSRSPLIYIPRRPDPLHTRSALSFPHKPSRKRPLGKTTLRGTFAGVARQHGAHSDCDAGRHLHEASLAGDSTMTRKLREEAHQANMKHSSPSRTRP